MAETWDYLIILDACRYDYFERLYPQNFQGALSKRSSIATCTRDWLQKAFTKYYDDCVYISANANINNSLKQQRNLNFKAIEHFHKIVEVWKDGWDDRVGTVPPDAVNSAALKSIYENRGKRFIIHYMQPHYPYLGMQNKSRGKIKHKYVWTVRNTLSAILGTRLGIKMANRLAPNDEEYVAKRIGVEQLKMCYENNLETVLRSVSKLLIHLQGKIVITSDHGELLGEGQLCGHPCAFTAKELTIVPWLEIVRNEREDYVPPTVSAQPFTQEEEELIQKRLEAVGYG